MSRSLVLNATYEPLSIVPSRRAAVLVLGHKADALHDTGEALHSEHLTVPLPSVVRLRSFVKVPYRRRRSEEHTSELQSLMRISYAVFCLKKKKTTRRK